MRVATSARRSASGAMLGMWPRRSVPRKSPARLTQGSCAAARTAPNRWSLPRDVSSCRQGYSRLRRPVICSGETFPRHALTSRHSHGFMRVRGRRWADGPGSPPVWVPCRHKKVGLSQHWGILAVQVLGARPNILADQRLKCCTWSQNVRCKFLRGWSACERAYVRRKASNFPFLSHSEAPRVRFLVSRSCLIVLSVENADQDCRW